MAADAQPGVEATHGTGWIPCLLACLLLHGAAPLPSRHSLRPPYTNETFLIQFYPPAIDGLRVHTRQSVSFNCTTIPHHGRPLPSSSSPPHTTPTVNVTTAVHTSTDHDHNSFNNSNAFSAANLPEHNSFNVSSTNTTTNTTTTTTNHLTTTTTTAAAWDRIQPPYVAMIYSSDEQIARPEWSSKPGDPQRPHHAPLQKLAAGAGGGARTGGGVTAGASPPPRYLLMEVWEGQQHNFSIQALHVGRVTMSMAVVDKDAALQLAENGHLPGNNVIPIVATSQFPVTIVRGQRTADLVFDSSAAAIAILITFGIGCCTDTDSVKKQLKFPVSLIIGFCCQFILMPVLAFGLAMLLPIEKDIRFGLLCTACVPGGGLGHIAVIIGDADIPLSLTMNLISVVAMLGTAPLWIFVLGQYFKNDPNAVISPRTIPIYNFEIWLGAIFLAYALGLLVNRFKPVVADILLTWVIKPFLLLATILYITVGVYINMYVFELINNYAVLGAILLPLIGCLLGCSLTALCRQKASFVKTIALETSSLNCLIVLAALRFSLEQPDADLASMIPIWVMFTIPGLYVVLAILQRCYRTLLHYWNLRKCNNSNSSKESPTHSKDYDVVSAIVNRPGIAALSAPLVVADNMDDEAANNEKVTVL